MLVKTKLFIHRNIKNDFICLSHLIKKKQGKNVFLSHMYPLNKCLLMLISMYSASKVYKQQYF